MINNTFESGGRGIQSPFNPIRRAADYLLGRNLVIGAASMLLLAISGYATWSGMTDFITGVQQAPQVARAGATPFLVFAIVSVLTLLMWIALRETVRPQKRFNLILTAPLYAFLLLWSVGFGYGYWWSLIAGSEATKAGIAGQAEDVRDAAAQIAARLAAAQTRLETVTRFSERRMAEEERVGGSCGVASSPGRGPLWRARNGVRESVNALRDDIRKSWLSQVEKDLAGLDQMRAQVGSAITGATIQDRKAEFERASSELRSRAREIAGRSDAQGAIFATEMRQLASEISIAPGQPNFRCYDPELAARLREAAADADRPAEVALRPAEFSEGAAGVAHAVMSLWSRIGNSASTALDFSGAPEPAPEERLQGRDLISLLAAVGVDMGLLVLAFLNPPRLAPASADAFERDVSRVSFASDEVTRQLARSINSAIRGVKGVNLDFVRKHFIAHRGEAYFVAPNLYRCEEENTEEIRRGVAMNQLIGILDEYRLIHPLSADERQKMWKDDPRRISMKAMREEFAADDEKLEQHAKEVAASFEEGKEPGIFGKARRALEAAEWSVKARINPEIWPLQSDTGLTPLLHVLQLAESEEKIARRQDRKADNELDQLPRAEHKRLPLFTGRKEAG